jgi:hypothetical protein
MKHHYEQLKTHKQQLLSVIKGNNEISYGTEHKFFKTQAQ